MSGIHPSLACCLDWKQALAILDISTNSSLLPQTVQCPCCQAKKLRIYEDTTTRATWHYCFGCKTKGDLIVLAARAWKMNIEAAVLELARHGTEFPAHRITAEPLAAYIKTHVQYHDNVDKFWKEAQDTLAHQRLPDLAGVHRRLGIQVTYQWLAKTGKFLGGILSQDVEPKLYGRTRRGVRSLFPRRAGWGGVLVLPFQTLPGCIRSFLFIGRDADPVNDTVFRILRRETGQQIDPGLFMYDALLAEHPDFAGEAYIFGDPVLALRIQARHLRHGTTPLPIAGTRLSANLTVTNREVWKTIPQQRRIFWASGSPISLLRQARFADGLVATAGVITGHKELHKIPDREILKRIRNSARPWTDVLEEKIAAAPTEQLPEIFREMALETHEWQDFAKVCSGRVRRRIENIQVRENQRRVSNGGITIQETDNRWYTASGRLVSDAPFQVKTLYVPGGEMIAEGEIRYGASRIPFREKLSKISKNTAQWLRNAVARSGAGLPLITTNKAIDLFAVSMLLHKPETVVGESHFGWTGMQFLFPRFAVAPGGAVELNPRCLIVDEVPAAYLEPPAEFTTEEIDQLSQENPSIRLLWIVAAAVLANITAPAFMREPLGIALLGDGAVEGGQLFSAALGCLTTTLKRRSKTRQEDSYSAVMRIQKQSEKHTIPIAIRRPIELSNLAHATYAEIFEDGGPRNCLVEVNPCGAMTAALRGWLVLEEHEPVARSLAARSIGKIVSNYIQSICVRNLRLATNGSHFSTILDDLGEWFESIGGSARVIRRAHTIVTAAPGADPVPLFMRSVCEMYATGRLVVVEGEYGLPGWRTSPHVSLPGDGTAYIHQRLYRQLCERLGHIRPDVFAITKALDAGGVLTYNDEIDGEQYWGVPADLWLEELRRVSRLKRKIG